jgi:predicted kinase
LFTTEEIGVMDIIILIGLQASGKSTFYRAHFADTHEHISKDLLKSNKNQNKNQKQAERIEKAFQEQRSVVVDNTNVTVQDRQLLIDIGRRYDATIIGYYFQPDVLSSRTRNKQREGKAQVPDIAIFITAHKLEPPSYAEGFDTLYYVRIEKGSTSENPVWKIEKIPKRE